MRFEAKWGRELSGTKKQDSHFNADKLLNLFDRTRFLFGSIRRDSQSLGWVDFAPLDAL